MKNLIINFWYGKITLWKSYWLIGELLNGLVFLLIINIELRFFKNIELYQLFPFLNLSSFHILNKIFLLFWTIFITVGIWRSAESYKGWIIWTILTLIFLSYRIFSLRLMFV